MNKFIFLLGFLGILEFYKKAWGVPWDLKICIFAEICIFFIYRPLETMRILEKDLTNQKCREFWLNKTSDMIFMYA